jgi:PBS lyase HEAT-like repeat
MMEYTSELRSLFNPAEPHGGRFEEWPPYSNFGINASHIDQLITIACDLHLHASEEPAEFWAPIHAIRALAQLKAVQSVEPLLQMLDPLCENDMGSDWFWEDIVEVLSQMGPPAVPILGAFLLGKSHNYVSRMTCTSSLGKLLVKHPESKLDGIALLTRQLELCAGDDPGLNACVIYELEQLQAVEAFPLIKAAYDGGWVDETVCGPVEQVEFGLGLRATPPPRPRPIASAPDLLPLERTHSKAQMHKKKAKRKQAKASRKRNRR